MQRQEAGPHSRRPLCFTCFQPSVYPAEFKDRDGGILLLAKNPVRDVIFLEKNLCRRCLSGPGFDKTYGKSSLPHLETEIVKALRSCQRICAVAQAAGICSRHHRLLSPAEARKDWGYHQSKALVIPFLAQPPDAPKTLQPSLMFPADLSPAFAFAVSR